MFTVAVLAKEKHKHISESFGFVKCICGGTFSFDFETRENCKKDKVNKTMILVCPACKHESNEVVVPRYTDPKGVQHGSMKYKLVYLGKCNPTT